MKKTDHILSKIYLCGLPVILILALFCALYEKNIFFKGAGGFASSLYNLSGLALIIWMLLTVYLAIRLLVSGDFREEILAKATFMKERDEREVSLTGKATKTTFLMTLALLLFLLCLSCFQFSIYRLPPEQAINGKTGVISLGVNITLLQKQTPPPPTQEAVRQDIISYNGLPVSTTGIIILLIIWHLFWYNFLVRREIK